MPYKGEKITVIVDNVFAFGVFCRSVDNGQQCYIRRRELNLQGTIDPFIVVKPGDQLDAQVIDLPNEDRIMEISLRRTLPDPWIEFSKSFHVKDIVQATVKFVWQDRVVVEVRPGVDGTIAREDLSTIEVPHPEDYVWPGDRLEAMILRVEPAARKLQLSIRHGKERGSLISRVMDQVQAQSSGSSPASPELPDRISAAPPQMCPGNILVVDADPDFRELLCRWLVSEGCQVVDFASGEDALASLTDHACALLITSINLPILDGLSLARRVQQVQPEIACVFVSEPDLILHNQAEIERLGGFILTKPLDPDDLRQILGELSTGTLRVPTALPEVEADESNPFRSSGKQAAGMRSASSFQTRAENVLSYLAGETGAEKAVLFHYDPISRLISITAQTGSLPLDETYTPGLVASPVEDVISEDNPLWENNLAAASSDRFLNLLRLLSFQSCVGVPVRTGQQRTHALFIFHRQPGAFSHYRVRDVQAAATLISVALEEDLYRAHVQQSNTLLINGQLISAFNHEIYNKIGVLELQLASLMSSFAGLQAALPQLLDQPEAKQISSSLEGVILAVRSIKSMGEDFRNIRRGPATEFVSLAKILEMACEQVKPAAARAGVRMIKEFDPSLPDLCINRFSLHYIVYNLLLNAVQHLENRPGERRLTIQCGRPAEANRIFIRVADTGPGIHQRLWDKIFDLGYTSRPGGSGLGLYIARSLVETLGGEICVEDSLIDSGTVFRVEIPEEYDNL